RIVEHGIDALTVICLCTVYNAVYYRSKIFAIANEFYIYKEFAYGYRRIYSLYVNLQYLIVCNCHISGWCQLISSWYILLQFRVVEHSICMIAVCNLSSVYNIALLRCKLFTVRNKFYFDKEVSYRYTCLFRCNANFQCFPVISGYFSGWSKNI